MVSRRVGLLETQLGVQLLQRTTRKQSLTSPGRLFYPRAARLLAELDEAEQSIVDAAAALRGGVKLGGTLSFGLHHLSDALTDFLDQHPGIELDLDLNDREVNLVEEGFDMAVRIGALRDSTLLATPRNRAIRDLRQPRQFGAPRRACRADHATWRGISACTMPTSRCRRQACWRFFRWGRRPVVAIPEYACARTMATCSRLRHWPASASSTRRRSSSARKSRSGELVSCSTNTAVSRSESMRSLPAGRMLPRRVLTADFLASRFGDLPDWDRAIGITG